ncbi:MAG: 3 prime rnase: vacb and rnase ii family 3-5 exoribonuclease, partial [Verrucomicrobiales bacterium]|nr:3 prime rnase: vacb and rnase ii family 3-5 exoribonuclease [Verrucomicrobiales bacterium]
RRYADLLVHRALFDGGKKLNNRQLAEIADHISKTERNSADAERDSKEVKLFAFLKNQLESGERQTYDAVVLDILPHGFFVDLPMLGVGGFVKASIPFGLKQRPKEAPRLGGIVRVQVAKVDTAKKQVDFALATDRPEPKQAPKKAVWFYEDN